MQPAFVPRCPDFAFLLKTFQEQSGCSCVTTKNFKSFSGIFSSLTMQQASLAGSSFFPFRTLINLFSLFSLSFGYFCLTVEYFSWSPWISFNILFNLIWVFSKMIFSNVKAPIVGPEIFLLLLSEVLCEVALKVANFWWKGVRTIGRQRMGLMQFLSLSFLYKAFLAGLVDRKSSGWRK